MSRMPKMMKRECSPTRQRFERGSTLLEVLIAVVVLSVGLLGLAGLQAASLRVNQTALARSHATVLATDILDRMRANRTAARDGLYDLAMGAAPAANGMVQTDLLAWRTRVNALPGGRSEVCRTANPGANPLVCGAGEFFVVRIEWQGADDANRNRVAQTVTTVGQL